MSFSHIRGQINPVVSYYYDSGAQQRFTIWHVLPVFAVLVASMLVYVTHAVTSNVELVRAEAPALSLATPEPAPVIETPAVLAASTTGTQEPSLQDDIETWIKAHKGVDWAVSVEALDGSLSAHVNADQTFAIASIYKLFLLQPLAHKIPSSSWTSSEINDKSYASCVDAMIRVSNNPCAEAIGAGLGWGQAQRHLRSLGYEKTSFVGSTTVGTTQETSALLRNIYTSEGFDALTRDIAMDAMLAKKQAEGIRKGCEGCTVYNKTGDLAGYRNDAAIIEKNGKVYTVAIFSKTGSWGQIGELTKVIANHFD